MARRVLCAGGSRSNRRRQRTVEIVNLPLDRSLGETELSECNQNESRQSRGAVLDHCWPRAGNMIQNFAADQRGFSRITPKADHPKRRSDLNEVDFDP